MHQTQVLTECRDIYLDLNNLFVIAGENHDSTTVRTK